MVSTRTCTFALMFEYRNSNITNMNTWEHEYDLFLNFHMKVGTMYNHTIKTMKTWFKHYPISKVANKLNCSVTCVQRFLEHDVCTLHSRYYVSYKYRCCLLLSSVYNNFRVVNWKVSQETIVPYFYRNVCYTDCSGS